MDVVVPHSSQLIQAAPNLNRFRFRRWGLGFGVSGLRFRF